MERIEPDDLVSGTEYYVERIPFRRKGTFYELNGPIVIFQNVRNPNPNKGDTIKRFDTYNKTDFYYYKINAPKFEKKTYENALNSLSREDTTTGERVNESLGHKEFISSHKMFAGKKRKSKRRKSYRRRKSRKNKR